MDSLIFFAVSVLLIVPLLLIINLIKTSKMKQDLYDMNINTSLLKGQIRNLKESLATKKDIEELKDILSGIKQIEPLENGDSSPNEVITKEAEKVDVPEVPTAVDTSIEELLNAVAASHHEKESKALFEPKEKTVEKETIDEVETEQPLKQVSFTKPELPLIPKRYIPNKKEKRETNEVHEKSWIEKLFTENLLTKIGIVTLVLGVAFFVKYAIDQDWINEIGRVGIGILTGAILIGIAHKLRDKYHVFSSILVGGGIAVFYFTITLAFREYELFSQSVAFGILIGITILSVVFSLLYDSKELAIFSLLGGFASPLMISTGEGNYIVLFSFILILNTGMLVLSVRKNWHIIGTISYVLTIVYYMTWLIGTFTDQVVGGLIFAVLFYIQFYILTVIDHFNANRKLSVYHAVLLLSNNLFLLISCLTLLNNITPDLRGVAVIAIAAFNAVAMIALYKIKKIDSNLIYLLIAIILSLVTLAIPIQLEGNAITMFWAAESVILLWLWKRSEIKTFSFGFVGVSILFVISYMMDISKIYTYLDYSTTEDNYPAIIFNRLFITGFIIVLSYIVNIWLTKNKDSKQTFILPTITIAALNRIFKILLAIFTYIVIYIELDIQLRYYTDGDYASSFRVLALVSYTGLYVALLALIAERRKSKLPQFAYWLLYAFVIVYAIWFITSSTDLRLDIFSFENYSRSYFYIHLLPLVALAIIITYMAKNSKEKTPGVFSIFCWVMSILSVVVLSIEAENIAMLMFGGGEYSDYYYILEQVHTFVFPVLWGVLAMILMIWGLKAREVVLRKISLVFFAVIIVKFYAYDVWRMSQAGRIISFVLLGIILLVVSFLQQKIKTLVKDDKKETVQSPSTEQDNNDNNQTI